MKNAESNNKIQKSSDPIDKNLKSIKNHRKAATHLQVAAKYHLAAATYYEEGNYQKAEQSTISAHRHVTLSNKTQKIGVNKYAIIG